MTGAAATIPHRTGRALPWWSPQVTGAEESLVREVLDSNYLNEGDVTACFEQAVAQLVGSRFAIATTSGTSALFLALAASGLGPGDEVLVPDVTFIATANAVSLTGAKPVLVDIDPDSLCLDPCSVQSAITPRTRAIVPVHVSGRAGHLSEIARIAREHGLALIEDAAEAFGSKLSGKPLGSFGVAGCFSFSPNKTITTGQGGMVVTGDEAFAVRLRELKDQGRPTRGTGGDDVHRSIGYNFKLTNLQAAVGLGQLTAFEQRCERQREIFRWYQAALADESGLRLPGFDLAGGEVPQWTDALVENRDSLDRFLRERNIHCRRFWFPLHTQAPYRRPDSDFPASTRVIPHALWLPSAFTMTEEDVWNVALAIKEFLGS